MQTSWSGSESSGISFWTNFLTRHLDLFPKRFSLCASETTELFQSVCLAHISVIIVI